MDTTQGDLKTANYLALAVASGGVAHCDEGHVDVWYDSRGVCPACVLISEVKDANEQVRRVLGAGRTEALEGALDALDQFIAIFRRDGDSQCERELAVSRLARGALRGTPAARARATDTERGES